MTTTSNLSLNQPAYNSTAWDVPLNANETILDNQFSATTTIALTNSNVTLTGPNTTGTGQTQAMRFRFTGAISANITVYIPSGISGSWIVTNSTTGAYTVTMASAGGGTTIDTSQGDTIFIYSDGTNVAAADSGLLDSLTSLSLSGALSVTGTSTFNGASTFNATSTFNGSSSTLSAILKNAAEPATISASAATGTINFDILTQSILYYTTNASGNFTINIRGNGSNTFNSITSTGQVITMVFLNTNGSTAYYNSAFQIDSTSITPKWQGNVVPSGGNANSIDVYTYTILKTGSAAYTVLASQTQFV